MDDALLDMVLSRLDQPDRGVDGATESLILATLDSDEALTRVLDGAPPTRPRPVASGGGVSIDGAPKMYLERLVVTGFRGIGPSAEFRVQPGPGLTVICGRNGSGKSSFAEALEVLYTGTLKRWERRNKTWATWRCLHGGAPRIRAEVLVKGMTGTVTLERAWDAEQAIEAPTTTVERVGQGRRPLAEHGWDRAAVEYRPFLSHAELEALLESPKALHDQLNDLLGLDDLEEATERLRRIRTSLDKKAKAHRDPGQALVATLQASSDDRAARLLALIQTARPDLDAITTLALTATEADTAVGAVLSKLTQLAVPDHDQRWSDPPDDPVLLAEHLESLHPDLHSFESTLNDLARRRLLASGAGHAATEDAITGARRLWERLSLAVRGRIVADSDVQGWARQKLDRRSIDLLHALNRGAHSRPLSGFDVADLPGDTRVLIRQLTEAIS